jgi:4a-hydroxytetrahydrobiopterin dehydratase
MPTQTIDQLAAKKCESCNGDVPKYSADEAKSQLEKLKGWQLADDGKQIRKSWKMADFMAAMEFFNAVAKIAEAEDHHPDLHLKNYRDASIELSTHSIGGLSENDFILAAKIDQLPVKLKKSS